MAKKDLEPDPMQPDRSHSETDPYSDYGSADMEEIFTDFPPMKFSTFYSTYILLLFLQKLEGFQWHFGRLQVLKNTNFFRKA